MKVLELWNEPLTCEPDPADKTGQKIHCYYKVSWEFRSHLPFWLPIEPNDEGSSVFFHSNLPDIPLRAIAIDPWYKSYLCVRADAYPLLWMVLRLEWQAEVAGRNTKGCLLRQANRLGWAHTLRGNEAQWSDLVLVQRIQRYWHERLND